MSRRRARNRETRFRRQSRENENPVGTGVPDCTVRVEAPVYTCSVVRSSVRPSRVRAPTNVRTRRERERERGKKDARSWDKSRAYVPWERGKSRSFKKYDPRCTFRRSNSRILESCLKNTRGEYVFLRVGLLLYLLLDGL